MAVVKIIELIGSSKKSWDDAANNAVKRACRTLRGVKSADLISHKAIVKNGRIAEYRAHMKVAVVVEERKAKKRK